MTSGKKVKWALFEMKIDGTFTHPSTDYDSTATGGLVSRYAPDYVSWLTGIGLTVSSTTTGAGSKTATFVIPALGVSQSYTTAGTGNVSAYLEIDDLYLLSSASGFTLKWSEMRWYVGGVLRVTVGAATVSSTYFAPAGVPLLAMPGELSAGAAFSVAPVLGAIPSGSTVFSDVGECTSSVTGGWRFKETGGGAWQTLAVTPDLPTATTTTCTCTAPGTGTATATNTYDGACTASATLEESTAFRAHEVCTECSNGTASPPYEYDVYDNLIEQVLKSGTVTLLPDLAKSVNRFNADYRAMVYRFGMPQVQSLALAVCAEWDENGDELPGSSDYDYSETHPEQAEILSSVGVYPWALEDTFGYATTAPCNVGGSRYRAYGVTTILTDVGACPLVGEGEDPGTPVVCFDAEAGACYYTEGRSTVAYVQPRTGGVDPNGDIAAYLDHLESVALYLNTWPDAHWSFFYWFPGNTLDLDGDGILDAQNVWPIDGGPVNYLAWLTLRQQWNYHSTLPVGEQLKTRTSLVSAPLYEGALAGFIESYILGTQSSFWGITHFEAIKPTITASITCDSGGSARWSGIDCVVTPGATYVTLNPDPGKTVVKARFAMGAYADPPYMYSHLANEITVGWQPANVVSVNVYLVGQSGSKVLLATTAGKYARPTTAKDSSYAGSHAHDCGGGYVLDQGYDTLAQGVSLATVLDPERVHFMGHLCGQGAAYLEYEVTVTDPAIDADIHYPIFWKPSTDAYIVQENGHHAAWCFANGPGARYGAAAHFYSGALHATPIPGNPGSPPFGFKATAVDFPVYRNLVYTGVAHGLGVLAELQGYFEPEEGTTYADFDAFSISFMVPGGQAGIGILVNTARECPPLAAFPTRARDSDYLATGAFAQEAWSFAQEPRRYLSNAAVHLFDGVTQLTTAPGGAPAAWVMTEHETAIENDEGYFDLKVGGTIFAKQKPRWGAFELYDLDTSDSGGGVTYDVGPSRIHHWATIDVAGDIHVFRSGNLSPLAATETVVSGLNPSKICIEEIGAGKLGLASIEGASLVFRISTDSGGSFPMATTLSTNTPLQATFFNGANRELYCYWVEGDAILGKILDQSGATLKGPFTAVASGVDGSYNITARETVLNGKLHKVNLMYTSTLPALVIVYSTDGMAFA